MIFTIDQTGDFFEDLLDDIRKPANVSDTLFEVILRDAHIKVQPRCRLMDNNSHDASNITGSLNNSFTLCHQSEKLIRNRYRNYLYEFIKNSHVTNYITLTINCPHDQEHFDLLQENYYYEQSFYPMLDTKIFMKDSDKKFVLTIRKNFRSESPIDNIRELFADDDTVMVGKDFVAFNDEIVIQMVLPYIQQSKAQLIVNVGEYK